MGGESPSKISMSACPKFLESKVTFLPLLETLFGLSLCLIVAFQVAWFASLPPLALPGLSGVSFVDLSNYGQLALSFLGAATAFYLYLSPPRRNLFLLTGFASGLWFLSNCYWYLYVKIFGTGLNYPCTADVGFLGVFLLLATAAQLTFAERKLPVFVAPAIFGAGIGGSLLAALVHFTGQTIINVLYCALISLLLLQVVKSYARPYRVFFAGVVCYCVTMFAYLLRETYFPGEPVFTVVGQLAMVTFCLLALGLIKYYQEGKAC